MSDEMLNKAIELYKTGEKEHARYLLRKIIENELQNEKAWVLYLHTLVTEDELQMGLEIFLKRDASCFRLIPVKS